MVAADPTIAKVQEFPQVVGITIVGLVTTIAVIIIIIISSSSSSILVITTITVITISGMFVTLLL